MHGDLAYKLFYTRNRSSVGNTKLYGSVSMRSLW